MLGGLYNNVLRRSSTYGIAIVIGAFAFERFFDPFVDGLWSWTNKGKLWDHIAPKLVVEEEDDD